MRLRRTIIFLTLLAMLAGAASDVAGKENWSSVRSKNFYLVGDASEKEMRRAGTRLEQFREALTRLFPTLRYNSPVPITVIVFKNEKSFRPYKPLNEKGKPNEWTAGYFHPRDDANYIVMSAEGENRQVYEIIYHEYFHFVMRNTFGRSQIPPWMSEGLAEYYDITEFVGDDRIRVGKLNNNHLLTLKNSRPIPIREFFSYDHFTLNQQRDHGANIFYAQAWAMMHFLVHGESGARASLVNKYLSAILKGSEPADAFSKVFDADLEKLDQEFGDYLKRNSYVTVEFRFRDPLTAEYDFASAPVTEPDAKAILGDLLAGMNRTAEAEAILNETLAADPEHPHANSTLGLIRMSQGKIGEARAAMERGLKRGDGSHLTQFRYAYLLAMESKDASGYVSKYSPETANEIRSRLRKAIAIDPGFPESYRMLGFVSLVNGDELEESIVHLNKALSLSPGNEYFRLVLAELYARKGEFERSRTMAQAVRTAAPDTAIRKHADYVLEKIGMLETFDKSRTRQQDRFTVVGDQRMSDKEVEARLKDHRIAQLNNSLAKPGPGQRRLLGRLTKIECQEAKPIFTFESEGETVTLTAPDLENLILRTYIDAKGQRIGCDSITTPLKSAIIYGPAASPDEPGILISLEVVPDEFYYTDN